MASKKARTSKLNWLGGSLLLIGLLVDPQFIGYLSDLIPPEILAKVMSLAGIATMVLRTFFTSQPIGSRSEGNFTIKEGNP